MTHFGSSVSSSRRVIGDELFQTSADLSEVDTDNVGTLAPVLAAENVWYIRSATSNTRDAAMIQRQPAITCDVDLSVYCGNTVVLSVCTMHSLDGAT